LVDIGISVSFVAIPYGNPVNLKPTTRKH